MLDHHELIARQKARPALLRLHRALGRLDSILTVMNTGAHPDDEQSGLLALLRFGRGMRVVVACSTRGEGGQNALGPERNAALGVLRTREMEEAARELDADVAWLGHGPGDPVHDFGFSKDAADTLRRWGSERIAERLVRAYRTERPDIVIATFLDVPGQHGHHRAMTRAARDAVALAADPAVFPEHVEQGLTPWRVAKFYLPAWAGGGGTYDDELPPPDATLAVAARGPEPATGVAYDHIGEWSRGKHASQGMGVWKDEPKTGWALHMLIGASGARAEADIADNLPATLGDLAGSPGASSALASALQDVQAAIEAARASFPDRQRIIVALSDAASALERATAAADGQFLEVHGHRLDRKRVEIDAALLEAAGLVIRAHAAPPLLAAGGSSELAVRCDDAGAGIAAAVTVEPVAASGIAVTARQGEGGAFRFGLAADPAAPPTSSYPPRWSSLGGNGAVSVRIEAQVGARKAAALVDLEEPLRIVPAHSARLEPDTLLLRLGDGTRRWRVGLGVSGAHAAVSVNAPPGWRVDRDADGLLVEAPSTASPGIHRIVPLLDGVPAVSRTPIAYPHIGRSVHLSPEVLRILALDLALPAGARLAYVGGGADRVGAWLARMGLDVTELAPGALDTDLSKFTTVVVGIFAFGSRPDLAEATPRLHRFVEAGGHLVTLYHRPGDGWPPDSTPPRRLEIGSPSLRWRVTNPAAPVTVVSPGHVLLAGPNRIGAADWSGWDKERGLYFASRWDDAYEPLLSMSDPGEAPLKGALVSAAIGKGRHTHASLVLHHQLDRLVPGAFRLMANLVQPAT